MANDRKFERGAAQAGALSGITWFAGWLFTIGFVHLSGWQLLWGLFIWPYYMGVALR